MRSHRLLAFLISLIMLGGMMPIVAPVGAQDPGGPPTIQPSNGEQGVDAETDAEAAGTLEVNFELGNGGQPQDLPREVTIDGARFLFDRMVTTARQDLIPVAQNGPIQAFALTDAPPFDAIYLSVPPRSGGELGRYLAEQLGQSGSTCQAEAGNFEPLEVEGTGYVFAGLELFLTTDNLEQVASDSNGQPVYADPGAGQPFPELFFTNPSGLVRFVQTNGAGVPVGLSESLAIDGQQFAFAGEVTGQVDIGGLAKLGCAGAFPVFSDADPATGVRYVAIGQRLFQYTGEPGTAAPTEAPATPTAAELPTETATSTATEVPSETPEPSPIPSETPTATPEPSATPTATPEPSATPTETATALPTETPTVEPSPTAEPSATAAPTETVAPTATSTVTVEATATLAATAESTATLAATAASTGTLGPTTEATAEATATTGATQTPPAAASPAATVPAGETTPVPTTTVPQEVEEAATGADAPAQINVQGTTYFFSNTDIDIDITTLVEVQVITVNAVELTVYAERPVSGVAAVLYCVDSEGRIVGAYVPAADFAPAPPPQLPPTVEVNNTTYVFNQVDIDIDIQTLTFVEIVTIQNIEVSIYVETGVQGAPTRCFAVAPNGQVVGQYVVATIIQPVALPTPQLQPPAVVPTLAPNVPPPAAVTAPAGAVCTGDPGPITAQGRPAYLPNRIQIGGLSYVFVGSESPNEVGTLTRIACIGAFEVTFSDQADRNEVLYLRFTGGGEAGAVVYRFEVATTYTVDFEITGNAQRIEAGDQVFQLTATWTRTIYTSASVILFVANPDEAAPEVYYGVNVSNTVVGDAIGEYRRVDADAAVDEAIATLATANGLNPDLTVRGQRYLLVNVFLPVGTTTNGFLTLFSTTGEGAAQLLLGRDKRELDLFVYEPVGQAVGG